MKQVVWLLPLFITACSSKPTTGSSLDTGTVGHDSTTSTFIQPDSSVSGDAADSTQGPRPAPYDQGVWVESLGGNDTTGDGSFTAPFQSIGKAITVAQTQSPKRVLLCDDIYVENLTINFDGLEIYGGIDCHDGGYGTVPNDYSKLQPLPSQSAAVITVTGVATSLLISGVKIIGPSPITTGESAIAILIANSNGVTLQNDSFIAGEGAVGGTGAAIDAATTSGTAIGTITATGYTVSGTGAGGASIGVLAYKSTVTLNDDFIQSGTGGPGAAGQGDGGPSIGVFWDSTAPIITDTDVVIPGVGGSNGGGADGLSQDYYPSTPTVSVVDAATD